jgi:hypothetical protein
VGSTRRCRQRSSDSTPAACSTRGAPWQLRSRHALAVGAWPGRCSKP